ncbi:DUF433 domain-containing protein [Halobacterium sp. KA-4]|uniref:DUF433 domain-containing protein n=1 Tax=Halobacterium sp. KA-4 TaxID=2896367 RepID=UPI001E363D1B|nr:DUF433 domain-containing protein [Halobacterium sp. KA-4]MCD2201726.1 DUF433 domain-containing protein [Halobacterium sp. KA-4]
MPQHAPRVTQELLDEPHIEGRLISVLQLHDRVKELGADPEDVADEYALDVADVYRALAYYYENPEEMKAVRERRETDLRDLRENIASNRLDGVSPPT